MDREQKYIVVWNKALAQRKEWLVLGGASREAVNRTGIFHTGAKKALVALHLMGVQVVVASSDDRGGYFYSVGSIDTEIGDIVLGTFVTPEGATEVVETTYTTDIANNAWLEPFNGCRCVRAVGQFLLNAVGTSPDNWGILQNQDAPEIIGGTTRVYIPQTEEVLHLIDNLERYFTWGQIPLARMPVEQDYGTFITVEVYRRPDENPEDTVVYHTGLIAYSEPPINRQFRFAYNILDDVDGEYLSEERHLRSIQKTRVLIGDAYEKAIYAGNKEAMACLLAALADGEGQLSIWAYNPLLAEAFWDKHGKRACMASEEMVALVVDKIKRPVVGVASSGLVYSLQQSGVDKATDIDQIQQGRIRTPLSQKMREAVKADEEMLLQAGLISGEPVDHYSFINLDPDDKTCGLSELYPPSIGIREDMLADQLKRMAVLVHEHRHLLTSAMDYNREFINRADRDIVRLLLAVADGRSIDEVADEGD